MSLPGARTQEIPEIQPHQTFKGHTSAVLGVTHIPGKQRIITCSEDGSLRLWNTENGLQIGKDWKDGRSPVNTIALSPDKKTLASGSDDYAVRLWDVDTKKVIAKWTEHSQRVWSLCWSRDGQRVTSGSNDGSVRVWDVESGETILGPIYTGHEHVAAAIYSPDETIIATCGRGNGNLIKIWDVNKTFKPVATLKGHTDVVTCLVWTADGKTLFSGSYDNCIRRWNTTTWKQIAVFTGHTRRIFAISISPNDRILASASFDDTVRLWNLENHQSIILPLWDASWAQCVSFSADSGLLATACYDSNAYTWDVAEILREADSNHVLSHPALQAPGPQVPARKSFLDADATRRLAKPLNDARSLPLGFFDDTRRAGDHIYGPSTRPHPRSSAPQSSTLRPRAFLNRFSSLFVHPYSGGRDATSHGRPASLFRSTLARFSRHHRPDNGRPPPEVEVSCVRGDPRNVHARAKSKHAIDPSNIMMLTISGPSQPPNSGQSSGDACGENSSSQSQLPVNSTPAAAAATTAAAPSHPEPASDIMVIRQAGRWTRFWLFLGCIFPETPH